MPVLPALVEVPVDRPRSGHASQERVHATLALDASLRCGLADLADRQGLALPSVALTGWLLLLQRLSGQNDLLVAVAAEGQATLPLRLELDPSAPVSTCLAQVASRCSEAQAHAGIDTTRLAQLAGRDGSGWQLAFAESERVALPDGVELGLQLRDVDNGRGQKNCTCSSTATPRCSTPARCSATSVMASACLRRWSTPANSPSIVSP